MIAERKEKSATISPLLDGTVSLGNLLGRWKQAAVHEGPKHSAQTGGGGGRSPSKTLHFIRSANHFPGR